MAPTLTVCIYLMQPFFLDDNQHNACRPFLNGHPAPLPFWISRCQTVIFHFAESLVMHLMLPLNECHFISFGCHFSDIPQNNVPLQRHSCCCKCICNVFLKCHLGCQKCATQADCFLLLVPEVQLHCRLIATFVLFSPAGAPPLDCYVCSCLLFAPNGTLCRLIVVFCFSGRIKNSKTS